MTAAPGVPLHALTRSQCRYPVNDPPRGGLFLFCGKRVRDHKSAYCETHCRMCYIPGSARRQRAPISLPVDPVQALPEPAPEPEVEEVT